MKIYAKCPPTKCDYLTTGKDYEVLDEEGNLFHITDNVGDLVKENWINGIHAGGKWERIVRYDAGDDTLTVRDRFAMAALNGMLAHPKRYIPRIHDVGMHWHQAISKEAGEIADAMMEARKK